jgi:hypothetical protein
MSTVISSYSESNRTAYFTLRSLTPACGQSFTSSAHFKATSCKVYLSKSGSPSGSISINIYNITGSSGTDALPTGSSLGSSNSITASTISTSGSLYEFSFSSTLELHKDTSYFISVGNISGSLTNHIDVYYDGTSPAHAGNSASMEGGGVWTADATKDLCFYLYGDPYYADVGLRLGLEKIGVESLNNHKLRIRRNNITYGIPLLNPADTYASSVRVYDGTSVKALPKII